MKAAIAQLEISLATMQHNAPINDDAGNADQAALERANAESYSKAITALKAL